MQDVPKELWVIAENAIEDGTLVAANREQRNTDDYRYVKSEAEASNSSDLLSGVTVEEMQKVYRTAWNLINGYSHEHVGLSKNAAEAWEELSILIPDAT